MHRYLDMLVRGHVICRLFCQMRHPPPCVVYTSREGSGEPVQVRRLALALAARRCKKCPNRMRWRGDALTVIVT